MAKRRVTKEMLNAMAGLTGLELTDEKLDQLLSQVRQTVEGIEGLDTMDLEGVEPAIVFKADGE